MSTPIRQRDGTIVGYVEDAGHRVSIYDKELAKALIDKGWCTVFNIDVGYNFQGKYMTMPIVRCNIVVSMPEGEFLKLLGESLDRNPI